MSCFVDGDPAAPILLVAMAPGRDELAQDRILVGGSGKLLWAVARRGGWGREDCFCVNTIGEWPDGPDGNPSPSQYEKYWDAFDAALASSRARVAVLLGAAALWRVTGLKGIEAWRGYLVRPDEIRPLTRIRQVEGVYKSSKVGHHKKGDPRILKVKQVAKPELPSTVGLILPTLHPASVLRSGFSTLPALQADLARVGRALRGELETPRLSYFEAPILFSSSPAVAFDIENDRTTGVITRMGVAYEHGAWTCPWNSTVSGLSQVLLARGESTKVFHNIAHDYRYLKAAGIDVAPPLWDTMLAAAMLQPDLYKGLNAVASMYLDRGRWKHEAEDRPAYYNAQDALATLELYHRLKAELEHTRQLELFEGTVMPTVPVLIRMQERGIKMDEARRREWCDELRIREHSAEARWRQIVPHLAPSQSVAIAKHLYDTWGLPAQYGEEGGKTASVLAIKTLLSEPVTEQQREALQALLDYREASKLRSTYAENPLGDDGCVHPSYIPATKDDDARDEDGTTTRRKGLAGTGRITSRQPNVQNIPIEGRRLYVPHLPGMVLVEADYSQIELRVAAALSGDAALASALQGDVHAHTQSAIGVDRTRAKNLLYGTLYGVGPRKLAQVLRQKGFIISEKEARELQDRLAKAYPRLWQWRQEVIRDVATSYALTNPFGRRRYFFRGSSDAPAAIDFLPQSIAADCMWSVLKSLDRRLEGVGACLLATVHDSVLIEVPEAQRGEAIVILKEVMEQEFPCVAPGFRVPINLKVGPNWGEMHETNQG